MLRALFLFALLAPTATAQELEPFVVGRVIGDSLIVPLAGFDGDTWGSAYESGVALDGPKAWEVIGRDGSSAVAFSNDKEAEVQLGYYEPTPGLIVSWMDDTPGSGLAFTPYRPSGAFFVPADTTAGSRILGHAVQGSGGVYRLQSVQCLRVDGGRRPPTWCQVNGSGHRLEALESGRTDPRNPSGTVEARAWYVSEHEPTTGVRLGDPDAKGIDDRTPFFYIYGRTPYVLGDVQHWDGYGFYVASPGPWRSDYGVALPHVLFETFW